MLSRQNAIKAKCYQGKLEQGKMLPRQNVTRQNVTRQNVTEPFYQIKDTVVNRELPSMHEGHLI